MSTAFENNKYFFNYFLFYYKYFFYHQNKIPDFKLPIVNVTEGAKPIQEKPKNYALPFIGTFYLSFAMSFFCMLVFLYKARMIIM